MVTGKSALVGVRGKRCRTINAILPLAFFLSALLLCCYLWGFLRLNSLLTKPTRQWAKFDKMVDFGHLYCGVKTFSPLGGRSFILASLKQQRFVFFFLPLLFPRH